MVAANHPQEKVSTTRKVSVTLAVTFSFLIVLLLTFIQQLPLAAATEQTGSITGHVTASDGGNLGPLRVSARPFSNGPDAAITTLDANGYYTLSGLTSGIYSVFFNIDQELPSQDHYSPYLQEYYNDAHTIEDTDPVSVTANPPVGGIDTVLQLGGVITGHVTLSGTGAPIVGIPVYIRPPLGSNVTDRKATTDANGRYQFIGLSGVEYEVCFALYASENALYLPQCYDHVDSPSDAKKISVVEGTTISNVNAALTLGGMIQGRVTSEATGKALAGTYVQASGFNVSTSNGAFSDANGYYTITSLPTGNYQLSFGGVDGNIAYGIECYDNKPCTGIADLVAVTQNMTTTGIDAALTLVLNITGKVEDAVTHAPLQFIPVYAYSPDGRRQESSAVTDESGNYSLSYLAPGPYRIGFGDESVGRQYYSNHILFEEADWVTVTTNVVISHIDAAFVGRTGSEISLASASSRPGALMAGRNGNFNPIYSLDSGQNWHTFATIPITINGYFPPQIAIVPKDDPSQPVRFLLGNPPYATGTTGGIFRSADGGASWSQFIPPTDPRCDATSPYDVVNLAASPANPQQVYSTMHCTKYIMAYEPYYLHYWTFYRSGDGGVSWQKATTIFEDNTLTLLPSPVDPARIYASIKFYGSSVYPVWARSDNQGDSWFAEHFTYTLALDWADVAKLYGVEDNGDSNAMRYTGKHSTNTGSTWSDWAQQPCRTSFQQLLSLPTADTLLLLCDQGLYRSSNGGDSWQLLTARSGGKLFTNNGDHELVLWVRGAELWGSRDQGSTWSELGGWQSLSLPGIYRH